MTDPTPNIPFIRDQWLPALRDGTYQQGREFLRREDFFCCLGVAADLFVRSGLTSAKWEPAFDAEAYALDGESGFLSYPIRQSIGLSDDEQQALIDLNDDDDMSFPEIADYIEAHILASDGAQ